MPEATFRVRELNELLRQTLALTFPDEVWVAGEISGLRRHDSGHVYFRLVDGDDPTDPTAAIDVALFRDQRRAVNELLRARAPGAVRMSDGVEVRIRGRVELFVRQGRIQLVMSSIDPAHTEGVMALRRRAVLEALAAEGLLTRNGQVPFPALPLHIGLVTAPGSAAEADFLHELTGSGVGFRVQIAEARVQGRDAERALARSVERLGASGVDVIAIVRGGGARTDLAAFDGERLARAVATAPVPVLTGIGHEIDRSVVDEVAARAHKTPTACAAALVESVRAEHRRVVGLWEAIEAAGRVQAANAGERSRRATDRVAAAARAALAGADRTLHGLAVGVRAAGAGSLREAGARVDLLAARTDAHDPARALARGWSITRGPDGRVVRSAAMLTAGDRLSTELRDGVVHSSVLAPSAGTTDRTTDGEDAR